MPTMRSGFHHLHVRKRIYKKHERYPHPDKLKRYFDEAIYVVAILGPVTNIPQFLKVWIYKDASGVSLISWTGFSILSVVWLVYGILHKEKPIIITNIFLIWINAAIALGAFLYG